MKQSKNRPTFFTCIRQANFASGFLSAGSIRTFGASSSAIANSQKSPLFNPMHQCLTVTRSPNSSTMPRPENIRCLTSSKDSGGGGAARRFSLRQIRIRGEFGCTLRRPSFAQPGRQNKGEESCPLFWRFGEPLVTRGSPNLHLHGQIHDSRGAPKP